jgi:hypothetical protein
VKLGLRVLREIKVIPVLLVLGVLRVKLGLPVLKEM